MFLARVTRRLDTTQYSLFGVSAQQERSHRGWNSIPYETTRGSVLLVKRVPCWERLQRCDVAQPQFSFLWNAVYKIDPVSGTSAGKYCRRWSSDGVARLLQSCLLVYKLAVAPLWVVGLSLAASTAEQRVAYVRAEGVGYDVLYRQFYAAVPLPEQSGDQLRVSGYYPFAPLRQTKLVEVEHLKAQE